MLDSANIRPPPPREQGRLRYLLPHGDRLYFGRMADETAEKQGVGRVSCYRDAVAPEGTALVYIPSLVAILLNKEEKKGSPLTREEVLYFRDNAAVLVIPQSAVGLAEQRRGYCDIDPSRCWEEWLEVREKRAARG